MRSQWLNAGEESENKTGRGGNQVERKRRAEVEKSAEGETETHSSRDQRKKRGWPSAGAWREPSPRFSHDARYIKDRQTDGRMDG